MLVQIRGKLMAVVSHTVSSMLYRKINHLGLHEESRHRGLWESPHKQKVSFFPPFPKQLRVHKNSRTEYFSTLENISL